MTDKPKVIVGRGQKVEEAGLYWWQVKDCEPGYVIKTALDVFTKGYRYMKANPPEFPTPEVIPPKPSLELKLYRVIRGEKNGQLFWGFPRFERSEFIGAVLCVATEGRNVGDFHNDQWIEEYLQ